MKNFPWKHCLMKSTIYISASKITQVEIEIKEDILWYEIKF